MIRQGWSWLDCRRCSGSPPGGTSSPIDLDSRALWPPSSGSACVRRRDRGSVSPARASSPTADTRRRRWLPSPVGRWTLPPPGCRSRYNPHGRWSAQTSYSTWPRNNIGLIIIIMRSARLGPGVAGVKVIRNAVPGLGNLSLERSGCKTIGFHYREGLRVPGPSKLATFIRFKFHIFTIINSQCRVFYKILQN